MYKSIEPELHQLREELGVSPVDQAFAGLHHVRYLVAPGTALSFIYEWTKKTRYRFDTAFYNSADKCKYYILRLAENPIALIIQESSTPLQGFPRLQGLGFLVRDLEPVREVLRTENVSFSDVDEGVATAPLAGLGDRFWYVTKQEMDWFHARDFHPYELKNSHQRPMRTVDPLLQAVQGIDHIAYRTRLEDVREAARLLMRLTAYRFDSCYTVGDQNAETMVFRWGDEKPAMVASYGWDADSVVHRYVAKYAPRVHHLAFYVNQVLSLVAHQKSSGIAFTTAEMIGDESRGILQIFSTPSTYSHEICEYIERFGGFRGFFDKGNVGELMNSTKKFN